jgi:hypothetical protein
MATANGRHATDILARGIELAKAEAADATPDANPYDAFPSEMAAAWDAEAPAELWGDDCDDDVWMTGPEPFDPTPADEAAFAPAERMTLAELVDRQADQYRAWANPVGEMLAQAMDRLALQIRLTAATTPAELEARVDELDAAQRETWEAIGFEQGRSSCPCQREIR